MTTHTAVTSKPVVHPKPASTKPRPTHVQNSKPLAATHKPKPEANTAAINKWTATVYKEAFGRAPTKDELKASAARFAQLSKAGKHPWAAGAAIIKDLKATQEFSKKNPHADEVEKMYQTLYKREPSLGELSSAQKLVDKVEAGGGNARDALKFLGGVMRSDSQYQHAHPFGPMVDKLFSDGLGRTPTAEELKSAEDFIGKHARASGSALKGIFEAGHALENLMKASPEFKAHNPLVKLFNNLYQSNLGRAPSVAEIGNATRLSKELARDGRNIFQIGREVQNTIRATNEYRQRAAAMAAAGGVPAGNAGQVTGYVRGQPQTFNVSSVGNGEVLRSDAAAAFLAMQRDARAAGINISAGSGFRTNEEQIELYRRYMNGTGNEAARPGYSNHQGGVAMDIKGVGSYGSAAYKWLKANAGRYGFVDDVGGEYWHWHYTR